MKTRPDNYRVNKTGQLQKLTTGATTGATAVNVITTSGMSGYGWVAPWVPGGAETRAQSRR